MVRTQCSVVLLVVAQTTVAQGAYAFMCVRVCVNHGHKTEHLQTKQGVIHKRISYCILLALYTERFQKEREFTARSI